MTTLNTSKTRLIALPLTLFAVVMSGCNCNEVINAIPEPNIELAFADDVTPPLERLDIALTPPALGDTQETTITLRNVGGIQLNIESAQLVSDDECPSASGAFVLTTPPPESLQPNEEVDVVISFTPQSAALACTTLLVKSDDLGEPEVKATLRGQGDAARLCADRALIDFGSVDVGSTADDVIELRSCGTRPITLESFSQNAQFPPFGADLPGPTTLAPDEVLSIDVSFSPTDVRTFSIAGGTQGTIIIETDAFGQSYQIDLVGSSRFPPACRLQTTPSAMNFGQIASGRSATQPLVIRNIGELECDLENVSLQTAGTSFSLGAVTVPAQLAAGDTVVVDVTFAPATAQGVENNVIDVASNDPNAPLIAVPVEASSIEPTPCLLEADPSGVNFGNQAVGENTSITINVTNVGNETCTLRSTDLISGEPHFSVTSAELPLLGQIIPAGSSAEVFANYRPLAEGSHAGAIRLRHRELALIAQDQDLIVPLSGNAISPRVCVIPGSLDFGDVAVGTDEVRPVEVQNCGSTDLMFRGPSLRGATHPDFRFDPLTLPLRMLPGQTQVVQVHAQPTGTGPMYGALQVITNDANFATTTVPLSANAGACSGLVCTPSPLDFGDTLVGSTSTRAVTCANQTSTAVVPTPSVSGPFTLLSSPASIPPLGTGTFVVSYEAQSVRTDTGTLDVGATDCDENALLVPLNAAGTEEDLPVCPTPEAFTPQIEWHWEGSGALPNSDMMWTTPLVSRLEDTDGDGRLTRGDMPRVVFISFDSDDAPPLSDTDRVNDPVPGNLRALDGATGAEIFTNTDVLLNSSVSPALADIDADGFVEIIAQKYVLIPGLADLPGGPKVKGKFVRGSLIAFEHDGTFKWESAEWSRSEDELEDSGAISVGDIDGDGLAEIAVGDHVFNNDGSLRFAGGQGTGSTGHGPISVFVDLDGQPGLELVAGRTAYRKDGSVLWDRSDLSDILGPFDAHSAVADLNNDGVNEVVLRGRDLMVLNGQTGATLAGPITPPTAPDQGAECEGNGGGGEGEENPCDIIPTHPVILNIDGGADLEIGISAQGLFVAYKFTGNSFNELWRAEITDSTGASGPMGFDFESDGQQNVIYNDEGAVFVFSPTGQKIYEADRSSVTLAETSAVADVNNDGHANLIIGSNEPQFGTAQGMDMLSNTGTSWAHARGIWNQHAYVESLVGEMGTLVPGTGQALDGFRTATAVCVP